MTVLSYVLDTNVISDIVNTKPNANVIAHLAANFRHDLYLCVPVDYEIRRGYIRRSATRKLQIYQTQIMPRFQWMQLEDEDWQEAASLWANAVNQGRQLSDIDLLVAAVAIRLNATVVTSDNDFDVLSVKRVNWRIPQMVN
jgi:predicted nucleic acid-binding protein